MVISSIDLRAMATLVQSMTSAAKTLENSARSMQNTSEHVFGSVSETQKITATAGWVRDQLPGLRRRLALAQQIEAQVRGFQPTVQIDEAHLSTVPPDVALKQGAAAANRIKESGTDLDPALIAHIAQNQSDPYFAAGFAQNLTPAELAKLVLDISRMRDAVPPTPAMPSALKDWDQKYTPLITAIGTTMGTATRNTGELALPADYAMQWVNTITAPPKGNAHPPVPVGQGAAASLVLRYGNYSTSFLDTVSAKVYDYERQLGNHADREWHERSAPGTAHYAGPYLPDGGRPDPLENILEALSHNPQAAQNFFDVANPHAAQAKALPNDERSVNDRLRYLLQDRQWSTGAELGHALEAATTDWRDHGPNGKVSATIAAQTFALISQLWPVPNDWVSRHLGRRSAMPLGLRSSVAKMLASYMPDVFRTRGVNDPAADREGGPWTVDTGDEVFPPGQPFGAKLDPNQVEQIIATLGEHESDIQIVTAGVLATQQVRVSYALDKSVADNPKAPKMLITGDKVPLVANACMESAGVLGWVVSTAYGGAKANEEQKKKMAELMSKTLSIVTGLPILQVTTASGAVGDWSKYAYEQLKGEAISQIGKAPEGDSNAVYGKMDRKSQDTLRNNTFNLMLQAGYLKPEHFEAANKSMGPTYRGPAATALKGHRGQDGRWVVDQPPQFNLASRDYIAWARSYGDNEWIQTTVYVPYNDQWPNIR